MGQFRGLRRGRPFWLLLAAHALLACAAQVDGEYKGEPIMTLHGVVASSSELKSDPDVSAAIVWYGAGNGSSRGHRWIGERVEVTESFPANFSLRLYGPPSAEAEVRLPFDLCANDRGEERPLGTGHMCDDMLPDSKAEVIHAGSPLGLWTGMLAAIDSTTPDGEISADDIAGIDIDHLIYYFDHSGPASRPDPSTVTLLEDYRYQMVVSNYPPAYKVVDGNTVGVGYERGYHLARFTREYEKVRSEGRDCQWKALCVHWIEESGNENRQDGDDWDFEHCQKRFPDNPTCSAYKRPIDDEPSSSIECRERYESSADRDCGFTEVGPRMVEKPKGEDPLKIQLGLGYLDLAQFAE